MTDLKGSASQSFLSRFPVTKILMTIAIGLAITAGLYEKYRIEINGIKTSYIKERTNEADQIKARLQEKFRYIYQTIRTMALIPGVRKIDRYAKKFDDDSRMAVQQLYNNAYMNIKLSEIYLLPRQLDPDKIDQTTGKPEEPITTFDELVLTDTLKKNKEEEKPKIEEVEIFEYRLMKSQLAHFAKNYPTKKSFKDLDFPAISGPEVITCDNAEFTEADLKSKNDFPRMGLVFTVPVYDYQGNFNGGVSAVVRSKVVNELLPKTGYALVNETNGYLLTQDDSQTFKDSLPFFRQGTGNPNLLASSVETVEIADTAPWKLWIAHNDDNFWSSPEVAKNYNLFLVGVALTWLILLGVMVSLTKAHRLSLAMNDMIQQLAVLSGSTKSMSVQLTQSANEMSDSTTRQSAAVQETASSMEEISSMINQTTANTDGLAKMVGSASDASKQGADLVNQVVSSAQNLDEFSKKTSDNMSKLKEGLSTIEKFIDEIGQKTNLINEIVFQTKILSFNASVEAARAGEHGKGFAVVAEEVGKLARISGESAAEIVKTLEKGKTQINQLVSHNSEVIQEFLSENTALIGKVISVSQSCHKAFDQILSQIQSVQQMSSNIKVASVEQSRGVEGVNEAIAMISNSALENSTQNQSILTAMDRLLNQAEMLDQVVKDITSIMNLKVQETARIQPDRQLQYQSTSVENRSEDPGSHFERSTDSDHDAA